MVVSGGLMNSNSFLKILFLSMQVSLFAHVPFDDHDIENNISTIIYSPFHTEQLSSHGNTFTMRHEGYQFFQLKIASNTIDTTRKGSESLGWISYYVIPYKNSFFPYIDSIHIDKRYFSEKWGSLLLTKACNHLKSLGFTKVYTWFYLPHFVDGQEIYPFLNAHGFKTVSKRGMLLVKAL